MWYGGGWGIGLIGWFFVGVFWIVIAGLLVWAAVALLPRLSPGGFGARETPEEILDRRFAAGEIDVEQYRRAREELATRGSQRRP